MLKIVYCFQSIFTGKAIMRRTLKLQKSFSLVLACLLPLTLTGCRFDGLSDAPAVTSQVMRNIPSDQLKQLDTVMYCGEMAAPDITIKLANKSIYHYEFRADKMALRLSSTFEERKRDYSNRLAGCFDSRSDAIALRIDVSSILWPFPWGLSVNSVVSNELMLQQPFDDTAKRYLALSTEVVTDALRRNKRASNNEASWKTP